MSLKRARTRPVMLEPSGFLATGTDNGLPPVRWLEISLPATGNKDVALLPGVGGEPTSGQIDTPTVGDEVEEHPRWRWPCRRA